MEKSYKIMLSCVCIAFVFALLGFGIGRMTDTSPATDSNQTINANNTESENGDSSPSINFDDTEIEGDRVEVRFQDGSVWTIIADPSVLGDDFDWSDCDIGFTGDHE